jgi:hypothetical protein
MCPRSVCDRLMMIVPEKIESFIICKGSPNCADCTCQVHREIGTKYNTGRRWRNEMQ